MTTHTPGSWTTNNYWCQVVTVGNGDVICDVIHKRDATLIAAAPELLEALKQLLAYRNENTAVHSESLVWEDYVLPAIAKAEGR